MQFFTDACVDNLKKAFVIHNIQLESFGNHFTHFDQARYNGFRVAMKSDQVREICCCNERIYVIVKEIAFIYEM